MPSFQDSAVIFFIALLLFGPKKLPELARYVGKLMNEFRRASSEFRMQMDDEFRQIEQVEHQKKLAAMEAAAPVAPTIAQPIESPTEVSPEPGRPDDYDYDNPPISPTYVASDPATTGPEEFQPQNTSDASATTIEPAPEALPIASNGDLHLMPPETGLPVARSNSIGGFTETIPAATPHETETPTHG